LTELGFCGDADGGDEALNGAGIVESNRGSRRGRHGHRLQQGSARNNHNCYDKNCEDKEGANSLHAFLLESAFDEIGRVEIFPPFYIRMPTPPRRLPS